ncbi:MAG TPA: agmatinase family protein [Phycisphaerales bacterium]|nr:agmatinase family protein [Phycisphaerales bacterium]
MPFDPNAAADLSSGIFGLPFTREEAALVVIPVPFEATVSYGGGTESGPGAVRIASAQVDLLDRRFGDAWTRGIYLEDPDERFLRWGREARALCAPIIERGGCEAGGADSAAIDGLSRQMNALVEDRAAAALAEGRIPCLLGGEHSVSLGAIRACAAAHGELGILQIDAHMDLRAAYEGFRYSHASVMHNALGEIPRVTRLVQVGIRDFSAGEAAYAQSQGRRVVVHHDDDLFDALAGGEPFAKLCSRIVADLPHRVYVSFDIDGLEPSLCPHTGTPVPGGLGFREASLLLDTLARSGRRIVGCDLVEVAPGGEGDDWDANVGARVLFRLCMAALRSCAR